MASQGYRFANQELPARVFHNPLAFARAVSNPKQCSAVLSTMWERAGAKVAAADRQSASGLRATIVRADQFTVIHVEPPFSRVPGDACAIAVVGRGDGENQLENVSYYIMELGVDSATHATRFTLKARTENDEMTLGDASVDMTDFVTQCVELAAGAKPTQRDSSRVVAPWYWWHVCRGDEVMRAFCAAPESDAWNVVYRYPVLLLPELVDAAEQAFGVSRATEGLRQMHQSLRGTPHYAPFHRMLAMVLAETIGGSPRVNLERALAVIGDARHAVLEHGGDLGRLRACEAMVRGKLAGLGVEPRRNSEQAIELYRAARPDTSDPTELAADERHEQEIRVALDNLEAPAKTTDPTWSQLFLDETELQGFMRREDRRDVHPNPDDRIYALHGGVSAGSATWTGNDAWAVHCIVDTRWLFPSTKAAGAFVRAKVATFGEGLPTLPSPAFGDDAHAWGGRKPSSRYPEQAVVVRVGRMVAKLHVTEGAKAPSVFQVLSQPMLRPYAEAIVRRARWALSQYWLAVASGTEAANRFVAAPARTAHQLFTEYPILLLPDFPTAMSSLGETHRAAAERLAGMQPNLRSNNWSQYRDVMRALVRTLLDETAGEPRVNADAALSLVVDHRRLDPDYSWAAIENECRTRADQK